MSGLRTPLLRADSLCVWRASDWRSGDIHLKLQPAQLVCLEGANGAGKSTVLRAFAGVYEDYSGHCERYAQVAYVGHRSGYKETLNLEHNLLWYAMLWGVSADTVRHCIERFFLKEHARKPVAQLSAGQRQRAVLARLLLSRAPIWLLDEPASSLDEDARQLLSELIGEHCATGGAVVQTVATGGALRCRVETDGATRRNLGICDKPIESPQPVSYGAYLLGLWQRDRHLLWHEHRVWRMPLLFALAAMLPALLVVYDIAALALLAPVLLWSLALLVIFLAGDELCARDWEDDTLTQLCLAQVPMWHGALVRIAALWWTLCLPMALIALPLAVVLGMTGEAVVVLVAGLVTGGVTLSALLVAGGALSAPLRGRAVLSALMLLPLALPVPIFGVVAVEASVAGINPLPALALQTALSLGSCMLLSPLTAVGWRISASV